MDIIIQGIIGGSVPAIVMIIFYFWSVEKRITKIEADLYWIKRKKE